jgi:hypothetical protein
MPNLGFRGFFSQILQKYVKNRILQKTVTKNTFKGPKEFCDIP